MRMHYSYYAYMHATRNVYQTCIRIVAEYLLSLKNAIHGSITFIQLLSRFSSIIL